MPSTTLTHDTNSSLSGVNLKWTHDALATIREITLVYFKNATGATIQSLDIAPSHLKANIKTGFDSGSSYQFQIQVVDINGLVVYSNPINLTTPYFLVSPSIQSIVGLDASLKVQLNATANILTNAGGDTVEFVLKRQSDNALFWIIENYVASGLYTLTHGSLINQDVYMVACMYQPALANANYSAPSAMSNSMNGTPSNIPNIVGSVTSSSVGTTDYSAKFVWTKPSDFNEWGNSFYIHLLLTDSNGGTTALNLNANSDMLEHTFTGLDGSLTYKCAVDYHNDFGEGTAVESAFVALTKISNAPVLTACVAGDTIIDLTWNNTNDGNSPITSYKVYDSIDTLIATVVTADVNSSYQVTGLANGVQKGYKIATVNAIGESIKSNLMQATPFGNMSIVSVISTGKQLDVTITPNGKSVSRVILLGLDADPDEFTAGNNIFDIPRAQISQSVTGNIVVTKTFTNLSGNLTFHLAVVHSDAGNIEFVKST